MTISNTKLKTQTRRPNIQVTLELLLSGYPFTHLTTPFTSPYGNPDAHRLNQFDTPIPPHDNQETCSHDTDNAQK